MNTRYQRQYMQRNGGSSGCGCGQPQPVANVAVMPVAPVCPTTTIAKVGKYKLKDCLGQINLDSTPTTKQYDLPQQVVDAYLLNFTFTNNGGGQIQESDVWNNVPQIYITDGGREVIPDDWTVQDWQNYLHEMGWKMTIEQATSPAGGQIVKVLIPIPFSTKICSGSFEGYLGQSGFTPRQKPVLHVVDNGDQKPLGNRYFHCISELPLQRPMFEKIITKKNTQTLSGVGVNCWETPVEGCAEEVILYPQTTYADGVTTDGAVTIKTIMIEDNYKSLYTEDGPQTIDYYELCDTTKVTDSHWVPVHFSCKDCCTDGCLGLNCKTKFKIECGVQGGSQLGIRYIILIPAYDGTPCCC